MTDSLPPAEQCRIAVVGTSGSGKTTLARAVAQRLGIPHIELDSLHWLPDWQMRPNDELRALVQERVAGPAWVVDGNYRNKVQDLVISRANVFVWLNYSRSVVMRRVIWRTFVRAVTRRRLFSGNREQLRTVLFSRDSIVRWAWTSHAVNHRTYRQLVDHDLPEHVSLFEHTTPTETAAWLRPLSASTELSDAAHRC
ncbi:AAA family ATPase [Maioricimonas rarisocia]|nr:AAA family ATPase [Maioricimonas rarisocia]